jgi:uncharacterized membrane protein
VCQHAEQGRCRKYVSGRARTLTHDSPSGLVVPHDPSPDSWGFLYFATSIGATSLTSDVLIRSKGLRRVVTLHAIVSFFFNTMVLALTINLAAGMIWRTKEPGMSSWLQENR